MAQYQVLFSWMWRAAGSHTLLRWTLHSEVFDQGPFCSPCQIRILMRMESSKNHGLQFSRALCPNSRKGEFEAQVRAGAQLWALFTYPVTLALPQRIPAAWDEQLLPPLPLHALGTALLSTRPAPWGDVHSTCVILCHICVILPGWPSWGFPRERSHPLRIQLGAESAAVYMQNSSHATTAVGKQPWYFTLSWRTGVRKTVLQFLFRRQLLCFLFLLLSLLCMLYLISNPTVFLL